MGAITGGATFLGDSAGARATPAGRFDILLVVTLYWRGVKGVTGAGKKCPSITGMVAKSSTYEAFLMQADSNWLICIVQDTSPLLTAAASSLTRAKPLTVFAAAYEGVI